MGCEYVDIPSSYIWNIRFDDGIGHSLMWRYYMFTMATIAAKAAAMVFCAIYLNKSTSLTPTHTYTLALIAKRVHQRIDCYVYTCARIESSHLRLSLSMYLVNISFICTQTSCAGHRNQPANAYSPHTRGSFHGAHANVDRFHYFHLNMS